MGRLIDGVITLRILKLLVTPFDKTDAFKYGIIDAQGKVLRKWDSLKSDNEQQAYTLLHRLVFRLKRIIEKVPIENKKLVSLAAAYALIKEGVETNTEAIDLENRFLELREQTLTEETLLVEKYLNGNYVLSFKQFAEEIGNSTANVAGIKAGDEPPAPKIKQKIIRRKETLK